MSSAEGDRRGLEEVGQIRALDVDRTVGQSDLFHEAVAPHGAPGSRAHPRIVPGW